MHVVIVVRIKSKFASMSFTSESLQMLLHLNLVETSVHLKKNSHFTWWNHQNRDRFTSASGILKYSYREIQKATQNFTTTLGQGSFGTVYKATMPTGEVVAVKVLAPNSKQGEKEFQTEVFLLGRLHHRNLVNLVGYCVDKGQRILVYQYMSHGSLANLSYGKRKVKKRD
ncbi:calcium/calmodulin-regulated receptor-like kinase 2 [Phaseolus vulgaris]|uniref:calcium/calmodulin-regulated receptor-like kinase 2 n=1 Tax=Phaseolus vulgaris TaxID=3885 RepID=UPI0035C96AB9